MWKTIRISGGCVATRRRNAPVSHKFTLHLRKTNPSAIFGIAGGVFYFPGFFLSSLPRMKRPCPVRELTDIYRYATINKVF